MVFPTKEITTLSENYEFMPYVSGYGYVKVELVRGRTFVDGQSDREIIFHRTSFRDSVSGDYDILYEVPFGVAMVCGA